MLVIDPTLHPKAFPDLNSMPAEFEPFFREVRCDKAGAGVDEDSADAVGFEIGQLGFDLLLGHAVIPDPERRTPELSRRVGEGLDDGSVGVVLRFLLTTPKNSDYSQ